MYKFKILALYSYKNIKGIKQLINIKTCLEQTTVKYDKNYPNSSGVLKMRAVDQWFA